MFWFTTYATATYENCLSNSLNKLERLEMCSLERRRIHPALMFLYDTINGNVHCSILKNKIVLNTNPLNLRASIVEKNAPPNVIVASDIFSDSSIHANNFKVKY